MQISQDKQKHKRFTLYLNKAQSNYRKYIEIEMYAKNRFPSVHIQVCHTFKVPAWEVYFSYLSNIIDNWKGNLELNTF
jgi:hypothetical protein